MLLLIAGFVLFFAALILICAYALIWGGKDERAATWAFLAAVGASQIVALWGPHWHGPDYGLMTVDSIFLVAITAIALRSTRFWPLWAAAAQLVGTLTHFTVLLLQGSIVAEAYATAQPFWAFPILFAIAVGTRSEQVARVA